MGPYQTWKILFRSLKTTLTILQQLFVELRQQKHHKKSKKWVLGVKIWIQALKMAKIGTFGTFGAMQSLKNLVLVSENNLN